MNCRCLSSAINHTCLPNHSAPYTPSHSPTGREARRPNPANQPHSLANPPIFLPILIISLSLCAPTPPQAEKLHALALRLEASLVVLGAEMEGIPTGKAPPRSLGVSMRGLASRQGEEGAGLGMGMGLGVGVGGEGEGVMEGVMEVPDAEEGLWDATVGAGEGWVGCREDVGWVGSGAGAGLCGVGCNAMSIAVVTPRNALYFSQQHPYYHPHPHCYPHCTATLNTTLTPTPHPSPAAPRPSPSAPPSEAGLSEDHTPASKADAIFTAMHHSRDIHEVIGPAEGLLQWVFTFLAVHNSVDRDGEGAAAVGVKGEGEWDAGAGAVAAPVPAEGCTATFNDVLHHLLVCDMVGREDGITAAAVARAFQDTTGQAPAQPRVHPANR